jgi:hypothetical protein
VETINSKQQNLNKSWLYYITIKTEYTEVQIEFLDDIDFVDIQFEMLTVNVVRLRSKTKATAAVPLGCIMCT